MNCPKCGQATPMQKTFCEHCGGLLELSHEEVQSAMQDESLREAQRAFTRRLFFWMATSTALLVGALAFRLANLEKGLPRFDEAPVLQVLDFEVSPVLPEPELPCLILPVPGTEAK